MASGGETKRKTAQKPPGDEVVVGPTERREAVLRVIRSARQHLILSVFRCTDFLVLDELAEALQRGVRVRALLTQRAKGWEKRLKELSAFLESMGAEVRNYADPVVKYHAKYVVADDGPALIGSLNFTRKCFESTCDFVLVTYEQEVVSGLQRLFEGDCAGEDTGLPEGITDRLIIGPDRARSQLSALLQQARRSIRIIDHKVTDPEMIALLNAQKAKGVEVDVLGRDSVAGLLSHGKLMLIDGRMAVIGSISLGSLNMDFRREVAVVIRDKVCVEQLSEFFRNVAAGPGRQIEAPAGRGQSR